MQGVEPTADLPIELESPRSRTRAVAIVVAVLLVVGLSAALLVINDRDNREQRIATQPGADPAGGDTGDTTSTTSVETTSTMPTAMSTTPAAPTTPAFAAATTTAAPTTTTAKPRRPSFTIAPSSGPPGTQAEASGAGCTGDEAGIELTMKQPSGEPYTGDGAAAMPDGSWRVPFSYPAGGPKGNWTMTAVCKTRGVLVVEYEPQTFTVT